MSGLFLGSKRAAVRQLSFYPLTARSHLRRPFLRPPAHKLTWVSLATSLSSVPFQHQQLQPVYSLSFYLPLSSPPVASLFRIYSSRHSATVVDAVLDFAIRIYHDSTHYYGIYIRTFLAGRYHPREPPALTRPRIQRPSS